MTEAIDPDFARLMKGEVKLSDLTHEKQEAFKVWVHGQGLTLDDIKDRTTRDMMKRWDSYFPESK